MKFDSLKNIIPIEPPVPMLTNMSIAWESIRCDIAFSRAYNKYAVDEVIRQLCMKHGGLSCLDDSNYTVMWLEQKFGSSYAQACYIVKLGITQPKVFETIGTWEEIKGIGSD